MINDSLLLHYDIIIDEAHARSLQTDIFLLF